MINKNFSLKKRKIYYHYIYNKTKFCFIKNKLKYMISVNYKKNNKNYLDNLKYIKSLKLKIKLPLGIVNNIITKIKNFDWYQDDNLIKLRQKGYTPYKKIFDKNFKPKPMRTKIRVEVKNTLSKLVIALISNCDFFIENKYLFEILVPFKNIANLMNMVKIYKNGRESYEAPLHALYILEQLNYVIIYRDKNYKKYKPLRIWLTTKFFNILGIKTSTLSFWLFLLKKWIIKNNLFDFYKQKYIDHCIKIDKFKINIDNNFNIKNKLLLIKNNINKSNSFFKNFQKKINEKEIIKKEIIKKEIIKKEIIKKEIIKKEIISYERKYIEYTTSGLFIVPEILLFQKKMSKYCKYRDIYSEKWYKFLFYSIKKYKIEIDLTSNSIDERYRILKE